MSAWSWWLRCLGLVGYMAFVFAIAPASATAARPIHSSGVVIDTVAMGVHDGDTFTINLYGLVDHVRLWGVDAPELAQAPWGKRARDKLAALVGRQGVRVEVRSAARPRDGYGRILALVYLPDGTCVQHELLREGLALTADYGDALPTWDTMCLLEDSAKRLRKGVWGDPLFVVPKAYRRNHGVGRLVGGNH